MEIQKYVDKKKEIYNALMSFLKSPESHEELILDNEDYENLLDTLKELNIVENHEDFLDFIRLIVIIANNHHRYPGFFNKIEQILLHFKNEIKQSLSNIDIYNEFESNKRLLLFLIKEEILTLDKKITTLIINKNEPNGIFYSNYFIPELKKFNQADKNLNIQDNYLEFYNNDPEKYEEYRQKGENDSLICSLIRQDLVEDFISHVNRFQISLSSQISPSIFETNRLLNEKDPTFIEYACFFGSVQIFQYLFMNNVKIDESIQIYSIHSNNSDFFRNHIEGNDIELSQNVYEKCLVESIKCHHNEFASYFDDKLIECEKSESFFDSVFHYHNYLYFPEDFTLKYVFFYLCFYNYTEIVDLYINFREKYIKSEIIFF